jgi:hypothetical protein
MVDMVGVGPMEIGVIMKDTMVVGTEGIITMGNVEVVIMLDPDFADHVHMYLFYHQYMYLFYRP